MNPMPIPNTPTLVPARDPETGSQIPPVAPATVAYWAISVLNSKTMWWNAANGILALLSLNEVTTLIPPKYLPVQAMIVAVVNVYLRSVTVRPVAMIGPGQTKPVLVPKVDPPSPAAATD
jgi:hypothetical protein